jgi:predicted Zn finger-like uncharacterized protein
MSIRVVCDHCQSELRVKDELAGKLVRCKSCAEATRVPRPKSESRSATSGQEQIDDLDDWLEDEDDDEDDMPAVIRRPKKTSKKQRRPAKPLFDFGKWIEKLATTDISAIILGLIAAVLFVMFLWGFVHPPSRVWFFVGVWGSQLVIGLVTVVAFLGIAARENAVCLMLCLIFPIYSVWYLISRWEHTGKPIGILFCTMLGGWMATVCASLVYQYVGPPF